MTHSLYRVAFAAALALAATGASAQESPWSIHAGPAAVRLHIDTAPEAPRGTPVPGGGLSATNSNILAFEVGYQLAPEWNARLTFGVPPTTDVAGTGTLAPLGKAGEIKYGPAVLTVTRALGQFGPVTPYLGGGVSYLKVFSTADGALANFRVANAWGGALQVGAELALNTRLGLFVDLKKIFLSTDVTGTVPAFGGAPAYARVKIDPFVVHAGVSYRF
jgi:outer membrane protein